MINFKYISYQTIAWAILFIGVMYFPLVHYIDHLPLRWWDESLFGMRALHMHTTGEYMSDFQLYDGLHAHRNTKMPFTTIIQVLFMKVMGIKVLALRLPVVLIFAATVAFTLRYARKHLSAISIGVLFAIIMVCSPGIVREHILRTGDQDMPFICYLFVMVISYFEYLEKGNKKYLLLFALSISAALLTKNLLAGAFLPGLLLYTIFNKKLIKVLSDRYIWMAIVSVVSLFALVIFYLENTYPGFVDRMWGYELMGRYTDAKDGHRGNFNFFFNDLAFASFKIYFWLVPLSLLLLFSKRMNTFHMRLMTCLASVYFSYLIIISFAETKLFWYGIPIIPLGAMIIAIAVQHIYKEYLSSQKIAIRYGLPIVFGVIFFVMPYMDMISYIRKSKVEFQEEKFGMFIEKMSVDYPSHTTYTLANKEFGTATMWYKEKYRIEKGYQLKYEDNNQFSDGELVMTCLNDMGAQLHEKYNYEVWHEYEGCKFVIILNEK